MASPVQKLRGTAAENALKAFSPAVLSVNTNTWDIHVHDGATKGGHQGKGILARAKDYIDEVIPSIYYLLQEKFVPVGATIYFDGTTAPKGYLIRNGALLSISAYPELFAQLGTRYGGDGKTTFGVGDFRGVFTRGLDLGRNIDANRQLGSEQGDAIRNLSGSVTIHSGETGSGFWSPTGVFSQSSVVNNYRPPNAATSGANSINAIAFNAAAQVPTANENRPRNMALLPCIKY